jgi:hypothetical protein
MVSVFELQSSEFGDIGGGEVAEKSGISLTDPACRIGGDKRTILTLITVCLYRKILDKEAKFSIN